MKTAILGIIFLVIGALAIILFCVSEVYRSLLEIFSSVLGFSPFALILFIFVIFGLIYLWRLR